MRENRAGCKPPSGVHPTAESVQPPDETVHLYLSSGDGATLSRQNLASKPARASEGAVAETGGAQYDGGCRTKKPAATELCQSTQPAGGQKGSRSPCGGGSLQGSFRAVRDNPQCRQWAAGSRFCRVTARNQPQVVPMGVLFAYDGLKSTPRGYADTASGMPRNPVRV